MLKVAKGLIAVSHLLFVAFILAVPVWSWLVNDFFGVLVQVCNTPAESIVCGSGVEYTLIAKALGRWRDGRLVGCSCGEGVVGDAACASSQDHFSLSYFIAPAPATGVTAMLAAGPILAIWIHANDLHTYLDQGEVAKLPSIVSCQAVIRRSMVIGSFLFGCFLCNTVCIDKSVHELVVGGFNFVAVVHFITALHAMGIVSEHVSHDGKVVEHLKEKRRAIIILTSMACASIFLGVVTLRTHFWWQGQHTFWVCEVLGLASGMSIAPTLLWIDALDRHQPRSLGEVPRTSDPSLAQPLVAGAAAA